MCDIMQTKTKFIINILILIAILILVFAVLYSVLTKDNFNYKLQTNNVTFYSDENILEKINLVKDTNTIIIVFDKTINTNYTFDNALIYIQLFAYNKKDIISYYLSNENQCTYSNHKTLQVTNTTYNNCYELITNSEYPIIYLGNINTEQLKIIIEKNTFKIYNTSISNSFQENKLFLEILYPNLKEMESKIEDFTSDKINNINSNTN